MSASEQNALAHSAEHTLRVGERRMVIVSCAHDIKSDVGNNMGQVKIKICGLTDPLEADYVNEAAVDFAGMVLFFPKSRRNIDIPRAKGILKRLNPEIAPVAVTVCPNLQQIREIEDAGFAYIQVHGEISDEVLDSVRVPVIKAFNVSDMPGFMHYNAHPNVAGFVFDAQLPGSGRTFDWSLLEQIPKTEKFILLAGGLNPENVAEAIRKTGICGVDTSSGVERDDGKGKSRGKILRFAAAARAWQQE